MSILRAPEAPVKPRSVLPPPGADLCPECKGLGWGYDGGGDAAPCDQCGTTGRIKLTEPLTPTLYVATVAGEEIDAGLSLEGFVKQLMDDWPNLDHDVCLWETEAGPRGPRVVAVLYPGPSGKTACRWL